MTAGSHRPHLSDTDVPTDAAAAASEEARPASPRTDGKIFSDLLDFVAAPRVTGLAVRRARAAAGDLPEVAPRVVAAVTEVTEKRDAYTTRLVEVDPEGGEPLTLTRSKKGEAMVALGERGEIFFASQRPDEGSEDEIDDALWMLPPRGEARVVLRRPGGVDSVIAAGGKLFIVAAALQNAQSEEDNRAVLKERKDAGVSAILHEDFPVRFWDHDLGPTYPCLYEAELPAFDGTDQIELSPLPLPEGRLSGIEVADDGSALLVTMSRNVDGTDARSSVYLLRPGGSPTELAIAPALAGTDGDQLLSYSGGEISPDGWRAIVHADTGNRDGHPFAVRAELVDLDSGERRRVAPSFDDWPSGLTFVDDSTLLMQADRRGRVSLYRVELADDGNDVVTLLIDDDAAYNGFHLLDGAVAVGLKSGIRQPGAPVRIDTASGRVGELAPLTPKVEPVGALTEVSARGADGTEVRAWLALPDDAPAGGAPLLVFVHGGPWGSWNDWTWRWNPGPFVAQGYAVLLPDPAISTGYGQHMIDRGNDELGGAPYTDLLALIDAAEARDDVDGSRTALLGGSYGGYMANWMAGHTGDRFSCIVTHASLWNVDSMGRTTDNGTWHEWMAPSQAEKYSPHQYVADIEVPMLVIHGDKDYRVPISQGQALWHALLRYSKASGHKFLYYPDENHWILKPTNARVWYETVLAFVNAHVRGEEFDRPELLG